MARVTTRAERHWRGRREGGGRERERERDRACVPFSWKTSTRDSARRRTYKQITVQPEREFAKIFIAGACFYPFARTRV